MNFQSGPKISIETSTLDKVMLLISGLFVIFTWILPIALWNKIPSSVPSHFNFSGTVDAFSSKYILFIEPIVGTLIYILFMLLNKIPHYFNYIVKITEENAKVQYKNAITMFNFLNLWLTALMLYLNSMTIYIGINKTATSLGAFLLIFILIPFIALFYFIFKSYKLK